ncbi:MAG TPA: hypothetical protein VF317_01855, partial [Dermatophilaceae bacterium]
MAVRVRAAAVLARIWWDRSGSSITDLIDNPRPGDGAASFGVVAVQVAEVALDQRPIAGLAAGLA